MRTAISEVVASLSRGAVGEATAHGRTGRFPGTSPGGGEVLVADITVGFCNGILRQGFHFQKEQWGTDGPTEGPGGIQAHHLVEVRCSRRTSLSGDG